MSCNVCLGFIFSGLRQFCVEIACCCGFYRFSNFLPQFKKHQYEVNWNSKLSVGVTVSANAYESPCGPVINWQLVPLSAASPPAPCLLLLLLISPFASSPSSSSRPPVLPVPTSASFYPDSRRPNTSSLGVAESRTRKNRQKTSPPLSWKHLLVEKLRS